MLDTCIIILNWLDLLLSFNRTFELGFLSYVKRQILSTDVLTW